MAAATTELTPQARRFESERIHASPTVLILAAIGLAIYSLRGILGSSQAISAVTCVGTIVVAIAVVLHFDHLSFRLGRSAVVLVILGVVLQGVERLWMALGNTGHGPWWFEAFGYVFAGVGVVMVAIRKEAQMKASLADYAAGAPWQARVTVHASFFSLITGAIGLVLFGIGLMGYASDSSRLPPVVMCVGGVLGAIGVISHVKHLVPRIGLVAVIAAILAPLLFAVGPLGAVIAPDDFATQLSFWYVWRGAGALLAALACVLAFQKKLSTDR